MSPSASGSVDRVRGVATGLLTAALAVAAHGGGGGPLPNGATLALLVVLATTVGAVAAVIPRLNAPRHLLVVLAIGQLLAHLLLSAANHHDAGPSGVAMLAAHVLAVMAGAALVGAGGRLWRALSRAARRMARAASRVTVRPAGAARSTDQPLRSALLLAASVSHRGPPVSFRC